MIVFLLSRIALYKYVMLCYVMLLQSLDFWYMLKENIDIFPDEVSGKFTIRHML